MWVKNCGTCITFRIFFPLFLIIAFVSAVLSGKRASQTDFRSGVIDRGGWGTPVPRAVGLVWRPAVTDRVVWLMIALMMLVKLLFINSTKDNLRYYGWVLQPDQSWKCDLLVKLGSLWRWLPVTSWSLSPKSDEVDIVAVQTTHTLYTTPWEWWWVGGLWTSEKVESRTNIGLSSPAYHTVACFSQLWEGLCWSALEIKHSFITKLP